MTQIAHDSDHSEHIPALTPDAHHTVDWDRIRVTVRAIRPVRLVVMVAAGLFPAVVWCDRVAEPLAAERSVDTAFAAAFIASLVGGVLFAAGGRIRRWAGSLLLFAAVGGTLLAAPTRHLIAAWIVGA
ncbi:hypothetical protein [Streptomyces subrutilus]|uniref:MFS transporter n=1 Tax=Streptomyces subrutilus TaxID=36818 RepID=A0A1E5PXI4_9ACTN|nr:hypothetical protein [Streptomyces subrutilus]OEJ34201.1 hypothetical protein BGK67_25245 [Streptomyces subrutilus]